MFADDAKIYRSIQSADDHSVLQADLMKLDQWSKTWLLTFNPEKCKVMHFGDRNMNHGYTMKGIALATTEREKDLGVLLTPSLKPSAQVAQVVAAASAMLGRIKRTFTCMDQEMFMSLYKSLVRPRLEYAVQTWNPYLQKDITKLEKIQRRATKLVPALADLPYEERLRRLELTTLQERRHRGDLIQVFKILKGIDLVNAGDKFLQLQAGPRRHRTRGHPLKLSKPRHRTHKRNMFFSSRVVDSWNNLPEDVVMSRTISTFKKKLDQHMSKQ